MTKIDVEDLTISDFPGPERPAIAGVTPTQVGSITGVDKMDGVDRQNLPVEAKLMLLCDEMRGVSGRDPRGGGHAFVARPRVILQLMIDAKITPLFGTIKLQRPMVVSTSRGRNNSTIGEADIIGWWNDIPLAVRSTCTSDKLFCLPIESIPRSLPIDRQQAGRMRMAAHYGGIDGLELLRDPDARIPV